MTIFLRARDVKEYIKLLEEMVLSMNQDLFEVLKCSDQYLTEEALLESYIISANSPTYFERVLIRQGKTTLSKCKENTLTKTRIKWTKELLEAIK